jgi:NAD(P)-dependent dehydrogenase (short-subunit alcohol dehydrogenase family)
VGEPSAPPAHPPTLIFTGATGSLRGGAQLAAFATGKFALRALAQSLGREFGPRGVHVAHVIVDGIIDTPATKAWGVKGEDGKIGPGAVSWEPYFCFFSFRGVLFLAACVLNVSCVEAWFGRGMSSNFNGDRLPISIGICTRSRGPCSRTS